MLSNNLEHAYVLAKNLDKSCVDQICTILMEKTVSMGQMPITNQVLELIQNKKLKEVLEQSLYQ